MAESVLRELFTDESLELVTRLSRLHHFSVCETYDLLLAARSHSGHEVVQVPHVHLAAADILRWRDSVLVLF